MSLSFQTLRCLSALSSSSDYQCRRSVRITCCSTSASVQEAPPSATSTDEGDNKKKKPIGAAHSGIKVPRQRYISVSKSELLDAITGELQFDDDVALHFISLSQCLDSIIHAEHKTILEEMRGDFNLTLSTNNKCVGVDDYSVASINGFVESDDVDRGQDDDVIPSVFTLDLKQIMDFTAAKRNPIKSSSAAIPSRFQHAFMKLLRNAEFEELSPRDLMLTATLNTDYLLTLPVYVDWKRASESSAIIFRRGYATERGKGLLIAEKLDYLQSKVLQKFFLLIAKPVGRAGVWINEVFKSITQKQDTEILTNNFKIWIKELSLSLKPYSYDEKMFDEFNKQVDSDYPIWVAAQKAVKRYEGMLSEVGPRERLLRKFLAWAGLLPSTPEQAFDFDSHATGSESNMSPSFLSRISLGDIWEPASPKSCGNDVGKMLKNAFSILFSKSILQEPAFQELILLYTEKSGESETSDLAEVPSLQMKIYERIPIPDLPVVFPHKKLSFRILDAVRLDVATILGLLAYFFSYKFEDILSSPSAVFLDVIPTVALVIYVSRVVLGYKGTRDRYQLLVNRTLYEKTVASGFGSIHFLLDASEQQQYKEAILVYATLLKAKSGQVTSTRAIGHECETFIYDVFGEKIEMPVDKAMETLLRLGLVTEKIVDGQVVVQAVPCEMAHSILRNRWNTLIN